MNDYLKIIDLNIVQARKMIKMTGGGGIGYGGGDQLLFANETILVADLEEMLSSFSEGVWKSAREEYNKD